MQCERKEKNKKVLSSKPRTLYGSLENKTNAGSLKVFTSKKWCGNLDTFPDLLGKGESRFSQALHEPSEGGKVAVAYTGKNSAGVDCVWLLAWADSDTFGMKVYVECGPKSKFINMNWAKIEEKLEPSDSRSIGGSSSSEYYDKPTGTSIRAYLRASIMKRKKYYFNIEYIVLIL
ncbi:unnamed protein product [Amaranthus hypochondriacus]